MLPMAPSDAHARMRAGFESGVTRDLDFRLEQLRALRKHVCDTEEAIYDALNKDLRRCRSENLMMEIGHIQGEIGFFLRQLRRLARPRVVQSGLGEKLRMHRVPLGAVLVIAPYNFPLSLTLAPLIGAIAAGNCVVVKPSEVTSAVEKYIISLQQVLDPRVFAVVTGGPDVCTELLKLRWDHIMFTGGTKVGRIVMEAAAKHLTPVTLELGGKNPVFVTSSADLNAAAKTVLGSRLLNAGQICLASDYCLVDKTVLEDFKVALLEELKLFYGDDPQHSPALSRMVSAKHHARVAALLDSTKGKVLVGGNYDASDLYVSPTIVEVQANDPLMEEEIFGPILSLMPVSSMKEATEFVRARPHPLALYIFTRNGREADQIIASTQSGSVGVNSALLQIALPGSHLGGVGDSGLGSYGRSKSFETFTHERPCLHCTSWRGKMFDAMFQPSWLTKTGEENTTFTNTTRLLNGIPFPGSNGIPVGERLRTMFLPLAAVAVAVAAYLVGT